MKHASQVHRLLKIILLAQQNSAGGLADLAERFNVTARTIKRDVGLLKALGVPIRHDREVGEYVIDADFFLPPVQLTASESLALVALGEQIAGREQVTFTRAAASAIEKIRGQLPESVLEQIDGIERHIDIRLAAAGGHEADEQFADVYEQVTRALRDRRKLRLRYESLNEASDPETPFLFHPYRLVFDQRAWYTIGFHESRQDVRQLKLCRVATIEQTDRPYAIPDDFSLDEFRGCAWRMIRGAKRYDVVVVFDKTVADTVSDTHWHFTQELDEHEDGSLTFKCTVDGLDEIVWWIMGYGEHAHVKSPPELVDRIADMTRRAAERYS